MEIVIASTNLHKVREFRDMFKLFKGLDILSLLNFPNYQPLQEEGKSFEEIAILKAEHAAKALNKLVLADDSGLVVPALRGSPGVFSRRYAGEDASDTENRKKLLQEMQKMSHLERSAYYECCLALAGPQGIVKCVKGICEGRIINEERGRNGFGYDSLFVKNDYDKTFAQINEATKNRISHRRKAVDKLVPILETMQR